jgi:hypothetical protein
VSKGTFTTGNFTFKEQLLVYTLSEKKVLKILRKNEKIEGNGGESQAKSIDKTRPPIKLRRGRFKV